MNRQEALDAIGQAILTDRNRDYGDPEQNFQTTATIMTAYLQGRGLMPAHQRLESYDVAALMAGLKLARLCTSPTKHDTWIDLAGYGVCAVDCIPPARSAANVVTMRDDG